MKNIKAIINSKKIDSLQNFIFSLLKDNIQFNTTDLKIPSIISYDDYSNKKAHYDEYPHKIDLEKGMVIYSPEEENEEIAFVSILKKFYELYHTKALFIIIEDDKNFFKMYAGYSGDIYNKENLCFFSIDKTKTNMHYVMHDIKVKLNFVLLHFYFLTEDKKIYMITNNEKMILETDIVAGEFKNNIELLNINEIKKIFFNLSILRSKKNIVKNLFNLFLIFVSSFTICFYVFNFTEEVIFDTIQTKYSGNTLKNMENENKRLDKRLKEQEEFFRTENISKKEFYDYKTK